MGAVISKIVLAVIASTAVTQASANATTNFSFIGGIQSWVVPTDGLYRITAIGAQGGAGQYGGNPYVGGLGAEIIGSFNLYSGQNYFIAVGGAGTSSLNDYNGGGGGGTFFVDSGNNPLLIAGGGGGIRAFANQNGFDASITAYGIQGSAWNSAPGAAVTKTTGLGQGGIVSSYSWGSGGAGFYSNGQDDAPFGTGGASWFNGLAGGVSTYPYVLCGSTGGFGGGGAGAGCGGGGGGGGYSGGDGGWIGGGGGSWNTGLNKVALAGVGHGNGSLSIEYLSTPTSPVPESGTFTLAALGLLGIVVGRGRKRN